MASHTNHPARPAPKGRLTQPVTLGLNSASPQTIHRIAMAPLTRMRNQDGTQAPKTELAPEYYQQRASKNGLLITEATFISEEAGGYPNAPGIYSDTQVGKDTTFMVALLITCKIDRAMDQSHGSRSRQGRSDLVSRMERDREAMD
jgi:hypothetical protein